MAMQGLGIPYMGSKRKLAVDIIDFITRKQPEAKRLYDIFGGGGAISFTALQFPQFKNVVWNDIDPRLNALMSYILKAKKHKLEHPELYKLNQVYEDKFYEWVSREDFKKNRLREDWYGGYVQVVWSFGNTGTSYLFGKDIEETKRLGHNLAVYGGESDLVAIHKARIPIPNKVLQYKQLHHRRKFISGWCKRNIGRIDLQQLERLQQLQQLERLQRLERLERLERLQRLEQLQAGGVRYEDINPKMFKAGDVVYLDPPYEDTAEYINGISHKNLYNWIDKIEVPVYLSSYKSEMKQVLAINHRSTLKGGRSLDTSKRLECLFWNEKTINNTRIA
jgi:site-specific DNA-adenine methylase